MATDYYPCDHCGTDGGSFDTHTVDRHGFVRCNADGYVMNPRGADGSVARPRRAPEPTGVQVEYRIIGILSSGADIVDTWGETLPQGGMVGAYGRIWARAQLLTDPARWRRRYRTDGHTIRAERTSSDDDLIAGRATTILITMVNDRDGGSFPIAQYTIRPTF